MAMASHTLLLYFVYNILERCWVCMSDSKMLIDWSERYAAPNYHPLPIVIEQAEGVWVEDPEGRRYMDMLSAYSALNHGHRHPVIIQALKDQADQVTLTSRAFHSSSASLFIRNSHNSRGNRRFSP